MAETTFRSGLDVLADAAAQSMNLLTLIDFDPPESSSQDRATDWGRERSEVGRSDLARDRDENVDDSREQRRRTSAVARDRERRHRSPSPEPNQRNYRPRSPARESNVDTHRATSRGRMHEFPGYSVGAKLGTYDGTTCFETFIAKFRNCSEYFGWNTRDQLFHLKASLNGNAGQVLWDIPAEVTVGRLIEILHSRFGSQNQAERFRAELRKRKRRRNEPLQSLYQDIGPMSLNVTGLSRADIGFK